MEHPGFFLVAPDRAMIFAQSTVAFPAPPNPSDLQVPANKYERESTAHFENCNYRWCVSGLAAATQTERDFFTRWHFNRL